MSTAALRLAIALVALALGIAGAGAQERVSFPSHDGDLTGGAPTMLTGVLYRPAGDGPFPAVVGQHGCSGQGSPDGTLFGTYADWSAVLTRAGFVVLWVDSFSVRNERQVCRQAPASVSPMNVRPRDAAGALAWLRARPDVRGDRVALAGWSHGGASAMATIGQRAGRRVLPAGVDFRSAVVFYPGWCRERWMAGWGTTIPTLFLLGGADDWTPAAPCEAVLDAARAAGSPIEAVIYPDAHHGFDAAFAPRSQPNATTASGRPPTVGGHPAARADARARMIAFLTRTLGD